ncbi:unnamed protein product, partial [Ectocarpus sp. 8 AP-2014]
WRQKLYSPPVGHGHRSRHARSGIPGAVRGYTGRRWRCERGACPVGGCRRYKGPWCSHPDLQLPVAQFSSSSAAAALARSSRPAQAIDHCCCCLCCCWGSRGWQRCWGRC